MTHITLRASCVTRAQHGVLSSCFLFCFFFDCLVCCYCFVVCLLVVVFCLFLFFYNYRRAEYLKNIYFTESQRKEFIIAFVCFCLFFLFTFVFFFLVVRCCFVLVCFGFVCAGFFCFF